MIPRLKLDQFGGLKTLFGGVLIMVAGLSGCGHGSWNMNVLLENQAVQLLEVDFKAGSKTPRHYHRDALIYALSDARVRITGSDGKPAEFALKANQVLWRDAEMRTLENIGGTDLHVLNFDLKKPTTKAQPIATEEDLLKLAPDIYSLLMANHRVRVLELRAKAGAKVPMHAHPDVILYFLNDAWIQLTFPDGKTQEIQQKKGHAMWLPAQSYALEVLGTATATFIVVEMKPAS
jgi:quercetin dioxygenase-like cupin family protein